MNLDVIAKISSAKINLLYSSTATPIRHKFVDVTPISAQLHVTTLRRHVVRKDMALLKYFKRVDHNPGLPDPNGSLSLTMRPSAIQSANEEVEKEVKGEGKKRGSPGLVVLGPAVPRTRHPRTECPPSGRRAPIPFNAQSYFKSV